MENLIMSITITKLLDLLPGVRIVKARNEILRAKNNAVGNYYVFGEEVPKEIYEKIYNTYKSNWYSCTFYWMTSIGAKQVLKWYISGKLPMKEGSKVSEPMPKFYEEIAIMEEEEKASRRYSDFHSRCQKLINNPENINVDNLDEAINEDSPYNAIIFVEELFKKFGEKKNEICVNGIIIKRERIIHEASDLRHSNPNRIGRGDTSYYRYKWTDKNGVMHIKNGCKDTKY